MNYTVRQLAELVHGSVLGDDSLVIQAARILEEAHAGDITFLDNPAQALKLRQSAASAAVVPLNVAPDGKTLIQVTDPMVAFTTIFQRLHGKTDDAPTGIDPGATVHPSARIGADPSIHPYAVVGENCVIGSRCRLHAGVILGKNCRLGDDVVLYPNVVLYDDTMLGNRVIIHANASIGADGFGYHQHQGRHAKIPQLGNVVIADDVEIGAGSAVDRGTFGSTRVGTGTKIDNLVQIGHNCQIGKHNAFAAQVGIGGASVTGSYVFIGGQAGVIDHIQLGDGVMLGAKTGVISDVPAGKKMFLYPAHEDREAARIIACLKKLPEMRKDLLRVIKKLNLAEEPADGLPERPAA